MLLAAAGQAAPYTYDSSATRKINNNNNNTNNNNVSGGTNTPTTATNANATGSGSVAITGRPTTASSIASTAACAIMKTLSVRLHRGTEFIKDTVQKAALVMSAATPAAGSANAIQLQPLDPSQTLKRKLTGAGGIMGSSSGLASIANRTFVASHQPYVAPTAAFLRHFTVAPTELHRSASARKRNHSTDSLLMDLCLFKPIRPMPITPIKINKARGFELKRPKFMPPAASVYSDDEDDEEEEEEEEELLEELQKEPEVAHKPKLSTLTLPQHATASAFVPHEASSRTQAEAETLNQLSKNNTQTSDADADIAAAAAAAVATAAVDVAAAGVAGTAKPKAAAAAKRRRRAPQFTAKRRRKATQVKEAAADPAPVPVPAPTAAKRKPRRSAAETAATGSSTSISQMRHSPPMTRQRARLQISTSSN